MTAIVHKAVEPANLSKNGKKLLASMLETGIYVLEPKYDGVYCQILYSNGWQAVSRTGEPLPSVSTAILEDFAKFGDTRRRYNGELWMPNMPHSAINGAARRKTPQDNLDLYLFDSFIPGVTEQFLDRRERRNDVTYNSARVYSPRRVGHASQYNPSTWEGLVEMAEEFQRNNHHSAYDGLMLKSPYSFYVEGHGKGGEFIKIKPRASGDFRVVGTTAGLGNREGGVGALVLDLGGGVTCEVGTGLTADDVYDKNWVGRIVEVKYLAVTKDGKLREPAFKSVRWDKKVADVLPGNLKVGD